MGLYNAHESHTSHPECVLIPNAGAGKICISMSAQRFHYLLENVSAVAEVPTANWVEMLPPGPGYTP